MTLVDIEMGLTLNPIEHLGEPFQVVDEQIFMIPRGECNEVPNQSFKIIFLFEGRCLHQIDDETPLPFDSGDLLVIPRRCRQRYWPDPSEQSLRVHALRLMFDPKCVPPFPQDHHRRVPVPGDVEKDFSCFIRHHLQETRKLSLAQDNNLRTLLADLREEAERRPPGYRFRATALCTAIVVHVVRQLSQAEHPQASTAEKSRARLVNQAKEYLLKNHRCEIRLSEIARHLTVSSEHLSRLFKQETGSTVFQYLLQLRLEKAKTLLLSSDLLVAEIARQTGFSSASLFSRNFRQYAGRSPQEYRRERWSESVENVSFPNHKAGAEA